MDAWEFPNLRGRMKTSYTKEMYVISLSLESYPSTRFIKAERDVIYVYENQQFMPSFFKN
jgi:hypothetical protein